MNDGYEFFVCVKCHIPLKGKKSCCGIDYHYDSELFSYSFESLLKNFPYYSIIKELQENEYKSYSILPESSLSLSERKDVKLFKSFINRNYISGKILDVGCGPLFHPGYLPDNEDIYGIDPIRASFDGVRISGCAEYMPFPNNYFETIIIATSLDHFTDLMAALQECFRALKKPQGKLIIWTSDINPHYSVKSETVLNKLLSKIMMFLPVNYRTRKLLNSLKIPKGAEDYFHVRHISLGELLGTLNSIGFKVQDLEYYSKYEVFVLLGA